MLRNVGPLEWLIIFLIILLVFGPDRLIDLGKDLGTALRGFKEGLKGEDSPTSPEEETQAGPETSQ